MYENPHFLVRRLAGSYKKNSVKAIASIFDEFTGMMNHLSCKRTFEKFLSHQSEADKIQAFSCVLLKTHVLGF